MSHYEYDAGECTDRSGDTTNVLIESGRDSYRMGLDQINRSRVAGWRAAGPRAAFRGPTREQYQAAGRLLLFRHVPHMFAPAKVVATAQVRTKSDRAGLLRFYQGVLSDWKANASKYAFYVGNLVDARLYFIESAFHALNGKWATSDRTPTAIETILMGSTIYNDRLLMSSDRTKQEVAERYVILAGSFRALATYVRRQHNANSAAEHAQVRDLAVAALRNDLAIPAPSYDIDYLPCVLSDFAKAGVLSCPAILQLYDAL